MRLQWLIEICPPERLRELKIILQNALDGYARGDFLNDDEWRQYDIAIVEIERRLAPELLS